MPGPIFLLNPGSTVFANENYLYGKYLFEWHVNSKMAGNFKLPAGSVVVAVELSAR